LESEISSAVSSRWVNLSQQSRVNFAQRYSPVFARQEPRGEDMRHAIGFSAIRQLKPPQVFAIN
jgi:hypothetical protein